MSGRPSIAPNTTDNTFGQYACNGNTASGATGNGEGLISGTSTEVAHLTGAFTVSNSLNAYGPGMLAGLGWNGDPVILLAGDSQSYGYLDNNRGDTRGTSASARPRRHGERGEAHRLREVCDPRKRADKRLFDALGAYGYRIGAIAPITALNGGAYPFTTLLSELGGSDISNTLSSFVTSMQTWWAFLRTTWPHAWLVQTPMSPGTTSTDNFTTTVNQTASQAAYVYPTGSAWVFNANLLAGNYTSIGASGSVDAVFDTNQYVSTNGVYVVPGFSSTLAAAASSGQAVVSLNAAPPLIDNLRSIRGRPTPRAPTRST